MCNPEGKETVLAVDYADPRHRRRFMTGEEMLTTINALGFETPHGEGVHGRTQRTRQSVSNVMGISRTA
ncbi:MAG: hypothetical protein WCS85_02840 [Candidatus Peribacteraceae bacterium]|jgi:hypothetical protein